MSIECKTEFHKNYASINMQYTYMFHFFSPYLIQITDYKNINEIFLYALKQHWEYRMKNIDDMSARLYSAIGPGNSWKFAVKKDTRHVHTRSHSHTWNSHFNIKGWDEKKQKNNFQRASEGFGCLFVFLLRLVSFFFQTVQSLWSLVFVMLHSYTDSKKKKKKKKEQNKTNNLQW